MYFVDAQLQDYVHEVGVLKYTVELDDELVMQSLVNLNLREQLSEVGTTFCFALFFWRETLSITLIA